MHPDVERRIRAGLPRFLFPWAGALAATLAIAALGLPLAVDAPFAGGPAGLLPAMTTGAGALLGIGILLLDRRVLGVAQVAARIPIPDIELALRYLLAGHLVLWSLAVIPAILGLAQLLGGGPLRMHLALCGISVGALAYLMPTAARIQSRVSGALKNGP